ncbi:hypothetical protein N0V82_000902 [Gnomoniopsis sp. IMI 355080]|nr:hypothetical protein N0V82_000902 [Gnomoniopsis sp. IMI 355080]
MNTPPDETAGSNELSRLSGLLVEIKGNWSPGNDGTLSASWERLLMQIQEEVRILTQTESKTVPEIDFEDMNVDHKAECFLRDLKTRGSAIIRNVIPVDEAEAWSFDLDSYLRDNPHTKASPVDNPELYELFWSLAQLNARAHPNMLAAQKFAMTGCWHHHQSSRSREGLSCNFPVTYADRVRMLYKSFSGSSPRLCKARPSVLTSACIGEEGHKQWEAAVSGDHSARSIYRKIWSGEWEDYDPWDSISRLDRTNELHNDSSSSFSTSGVFKMFQGMLPLSLSPSNDNSHMRVCSLPLQLTTAYCLLRPFFSPKRPFIGSRDDFLDPSNWALNSVQSSVEHASREINDTTHPHLQLERTLMPLPRLKQGDYLIWHPETVYFSGNDRSKNDTPSSSPDATNCRPEDRAVLPSPSTLLYLPALPLTETNAEYLVRQRKAFLLGFPGPDFISRQGSDYTNIGESCHMGRPGVQEINDAGGEEALRAMGLLAWDEDNAADAGEKNLLKRVNAVLFPDRVGAS